MLVITSLKCFETGSIDSAVPSLAAEKVVTANRQGLNFTNKAIEFKKPNNFNASNYYDY
jgi:hypothetical protein